MKDNYYFDNAATSFPKPEAVYQFMDEFARSRAVNPGRASHALAVESQLMVQQTRQMLMSFFGFAGPYERVVFTQNVTDSLNQALFGVIRPGDHVITSVLEHNSVLRPLNHMQRDSAIGITRVGVDSSGYIDPDSIRDAVRPETRLVVINHGSNVMGAVQDIRAIGKIAHDAGALMLVDTAQTAGVLDINMLRDNVDLLAFTGHKGLFGPMGTGGLIVSERVELQPIRFGGTGIDSIDPFQPLDYPHRLEAGTIAVQGIAGLHAAQTWFADMGRDLQVAAGVDAQSLEHGELARVAVQKIARQELAHTQQIIDAFSAHEKITVLGPLGVEHPRVATLSFVVAGFSSTAIGDMLDADYHICVRTGLHCAPLIHQSFDTIDSEGAVRISPGYFTEDEDVDHLIQAVLEIAG